MMLSFNNIIIALLHYYLITKLIHIITTTVVSFHENAVFIAIVHLEHLHCADGQPLLIRSSNLTLSLCDLLHLGAFGHISAQFIQDFEPKF